jgi:transposase, IS5 family
MVRTPGNLPDAHRLRHVCPTQGTIYGVKGDWSAPDRSVATQRSGHLATAPRNNRKNTNRDCDRCYPHLRVPDERFFAQHLKRVRYGGIAKNQFAAFLRATAFNFQRLLVPEATPLGA